MLPRATTRARLHRAAFDYKRPLRQISLKADGYPQDFLFLPAFFSEPEQRLLLSTALSKLDQTETRQFKRRRKEFLAKRDEELSTLQGSFLPDDYYCFEEACVAHALIQCSKVVLITYSFQGHFDGVIKRYREMHVSSWPSNNPSLTKVLGRLKSMHPPQKTQTHILHLASDGEILVNTFSMSCRSVLIFFLPV